MNEKSEHPGRMFGLSNQTLEHQMRGLVDTMNELCGTAISCPEAD